MSSVEVGTLTSLYDLAVEVRTLAEGILATTTEGTPDLSYVTPGRPAFDCCPALIVWADTLGERTTNPISPPLNIGQRVKYGRVNAGLIHVTVLRCSPAVNKDGTPNITSNELVAAQVYQDGWALWTGFYNAIKGGTFKDLCTEVDFDVGESLQDQGGCVGWDFQMRVSMPGII